MGKKDRQKKRSFQASGLNWALDQIAAIEQHHNKKHKASSSSSSSPTTTTKDQTSSSSSSSSSSSATNGDAVLAILIKSAHAPVLAQLQQSGALAHIFTGVANYEKLFLPLQAGHPISTRKMLFLVRAMRKAVLLYAIAISRTARSRQRLLLQTLCDVLLEHLGTAEKSKASAREAKTGYGTTTEYITLVKTVAMHCKRVRVILNASIRSTDNDEEQDAAQEIGFLSRADAVEMVIDLDACYYSLYYFSVTVLDAAPLHAPHVYFPAMEEILYESKSSTCGHRVGQFLYEALDEPTRNALVHTHGLNLSCFSASEQTSRYVCTQPPWQVAKINNPLLYVLRARWTETVFFFAPDGEDENRQQQQQPRQEEEAFSFSAFVNATEQQQGHRQNHAQQQKKKKKKKKKKRRGETSDGGADLKLLCPSLLHKWRNSVRDWLCHGYAYACPNDAALNELTKYGPIVELGCGTGYWLSLLQQEGHVVIGLDKTPPSADKKQPNDYHGNMPPFLQHIEQGDARSLSASRFQKHALLLCYPTPDTSMALDAITQYAGDYVLHVGELVHGDTGEERFLRTLQDDFVLVQRVDLPNFSNTKYDLTVWKRLASINYTPSSLTLLLSCTSCGATLRRNTEFVRSRLHRGLTWCNSECMLTDLEHTQSILADNFLFPPQTQDALSLAFIEKLILP